MAKRAKPKKTAKKPEDVSAAVIEAAMRLAAEKGWRALSLAEIAEASGLPLSEVYAEFSSKQAILRAFSRQVDREMLAGEEPGALEGPARDRLFDAVMRRFDTLRPYREAIASIVYDQARDPLTALCGLQALRHSMAATLEAADLSAEGCRGQLRIKGLALIYLATLRVWLKDDSEDLAKTMAALDRHLRRAESLMRRGRSTEGLKPAA